MKHIKKITQIQWRYPGIGFLVHTGIASEVKYSGGQGTKIRLIEINSSTENGKDGWLSIKFGDALGKGPFPAQDIKNISDKIDRWIEGADLNVKLSKQEYGYFTFDIRVLKNKGFCETVVEIVSSLARAIEVHQDTWFTEAFHSKQTTYVRSTPNSLWMEYGEFLLFNHPIWP